MPYYHTTRDGRKILLKDMEDSHLENTIRFLERRAREGITISTGGGSEPDDFWYDEYTITGQDALDVLNYKFYIQERKRRANQP